MLFGFDTKKKKILTMLTLIMLVGTSFFTGIALATTPNAWSNTPTYIGPGSMITEASYIMFIDDSGNCYAKDGVSGQMFYGTMNTTYVLQQCIYDLYARGGGSIFLKTGTYLVQNLTLLDNIQLIGEGIGSTIIKYLEPGVPGATGWITGRWNRIDPSNYDLMPAHGSVKNVVLKDLTFDCTSTTYKVPLFFCGFDGLVVENVMSLNAWDHGFYLGRCANVTFNNVDAIVLNGVDKTKFQGGPGIGFYGVQNSTFNDIYIAGSLWAVYAGAWFDPTSDVTMSNVRIVATYNVIDGEWYPSAGIELDGRNYRCVYENVYCTRVMRPIYIYEPGSIDHANYYQDLVFRNFYNFDCGEAKFGYTNGLINFDNRTLVDNYNSDTWIMCLGRGLVVTNAHITHNPINSFSLYSSNASYMTVIDSYLEDPFYTNPINLRLVNCIGDAKYEPGFMNWHFIPGTGFWGGSPTAGASPYTYSNIDGRDEMVVISATGTAALVSVVIDGATIPLLSNTTSSMFMVGVMCKVVITFTGTETDVSIKRWSI